MRKLIVRFGILVFVSQNIFAQDSIHSIAAAANISKPKADITKRHYGIYASLGTSGNAGGIFVPLPQGSNSPGGSTQYSETPITKSLGFAGAGGFEYMTEEKWRWYGVFSFGVSYYSYNSSAIETSLQYINVTANASSSQSNISYSFYYTMIDFSFRNYLRIIESHTQRLGAGIGFDIGINVHNNTPGVYSVDADIPILCLFIPGSLRYDISIAADETIAIEPYYNYEVRSVAQIYPRLASAGLKLSLLFN